MTKVQREIEKEILHALAERGQKVVAANANISDTRLSRWKSSSAEGGGLTLAEVVEVLAALKLRVVPVATGGEVTIPASTHEALYVLLAEHAQSVLTSGKRTA